MQQWLIIHIPLPAELVDFIECVLNEQGALSIDITDAADTPLLEPNPGEYPLWPESVLSGTFSSDANLHDIKQTLTPLLPPHLYQMITTSVLDEINWVEKWVKETQPIAISKRLHIIPSHHLTSKDSEQIHIHLDPGLAFGTGQHPTTQLCLHWLETHLPAKTSIIDFGCGSGILGITALRLGGSHCDAVDIDLQALDACQNNAKLNKVADQMNYHLAQPTMHISAHVVVANIISGILIENAALLKKMTRDTLVLSGILDEQLPTIIRTFVANQNYSVMHQEGWCLVAISKSALSD